MEPFNIFFQTRFLMGLKRWNATPILIIGIAVALIVGWLIGNATVAAVHEDEQQQPSPPCRDPMTATFEQMGILTPINKSENKILPLFGRRLRRDRWQYYTVSNQHNNIKLPIRVGKRDALDEIGVPEVYGGDKVYVEGYEETFEVKLHQVCVQNFMM
jgi:hypothetical protein